MGKKQLSVWHCWPLLWLCVVCSAMVQMYTWDILVTDMRKRDQDRNSGLAGTKLINEPPTSSMTTNITTASSALAFAPCPEALHYFAPDQLQHAIHRAVDFHVLGGNLQSVQLFKDSAIDETVQRLGLHFVPSRKNHATAPPKELGEGAATFTAYLRHHYQHNYDPRGGYGQQLPGSFNKPRHSALMERRWFDVMEPIVGSRRWDAALGPVGPNCTNLIRLGPPGTAQGVDGTKWLCGRLYDLRRPTPRLDGPRRGDPCDIISIGGNDNWQFEQAVRKELGCTTHTFDCTLP